MFRISKGLATVICPFTEYLLSVCYLPDTIRRVEKKQHWAQMKSLFSHSVLFSVRGRKHTRKPVSPFQDCTSSTNSNKARDFPGVPGVKNLPCNAGDAGSIPCWGTKIPHMAEQLSLHTATRVCLLQLLKP